MNFETLILLSVVFCWLAFLACLAWTGRSH
jgi:hypothetical protein